MQNSGRRPERRNRKIGTAASGHGQSNRMRIPESWKDRHGNYSAYYERVEPDFAQQVAIHNKPLHILYEKPRSGFAYGCSPADVLYLLSSLEGAEWDLPDIIAFRQPTQKQAQQHPVWGRFIYYAEIGDYSGTTILLEAQKDGVALAWPRKMNIADRDEFERLQQDGHRFESNKRSHVAALEEDPFRNTVLYRTLLHEIGHWVHYQTEVLHPSSRLSADIDDARELYFSKPVSERESFAHRFATELLTELNVQGVTPFAPKAFDRLNPLPEVSG